MKKFKNKFRIDTARMKGYDYGLDGAYFVTICTKDHQYWFGDVDDGQMNLSEMGQVAEKCWSEIPEHFPFVKLDDFVIMPNHLHGIIVIDKLFNRLEKRLINSEVGAADGGRRDAINRVSTTGGITGKHNPMLLENLSRAIRWYKGRTKFEIFKINGYFHWQPRFYDRIVRNDIEFEKLKKYIFENPLKWEFEQNVGNDLWI